MIKMYRSGCERIWPQIADQSIDCILTDPPYGTTGQDFDTPLDFELMWDHYRRMIKPHGAIIIFSMQPFTTDLIMSNRAMFRYDIIMHKSHAQGFFNAKKKPLSAHEVVCLFSKKGMKYNPQMEVGKPYKIHYKRNYDVSNYGSKECGRKGTTLINEGTRYPVSVQKVSNPNMKGLHPQGKPVAFLQWLLRSYTDAGDLVLDSTAGSFSGAEACALEGRNFIGIERDEQWFDRGVQRMKDINASELEIIRM